MKQSIIYITGFMAAGKTTIGHIVANTLGWDFIDTDRELERLEGQKVKDVFLHKGEKYFRDQETGLLRMISAGVSDTVVSLGGGTIIFEENFNIIKNSGISIYLKVSPETAFKRLLHKRDRPVLLADSEENYENKLKNKIEKLMQDREPFYSKADIIIDTSNSKISNAITLIINELKSNYKIY